jgi:hypothetical protein
MRLDVKLFAPGVLAKRMMRASVCQQVPICFTVSASVLMKVDCVYVFVFDEVFLLDRESSGSEEFPTQPFCRIRLHS